MQLRYQADFISSMYCVHSSLCHEMVGAYIPPPCPTHIFPLEAPTITAVSEYTEYVKKLLEFGRSLIALSYFTNASFKELLPLHCSNEYMK